MTTWQLERTRPQWTAGISLCSAKSLMAFHITFRKSLLYYLVLTNVNVMAVINKYQVLGRNWRNVFKVYER